MVVVAAIFFSSCGVWGVDSYTVNMKMPLLSSPLLASYFVYSLHSFPILTIQASNTKSMATNKSIIAPLFDAYTNSIQSTLVSIAHLQQ